MSTLAQIFDFNGTDIRTAVIDGNPWFVAADICTVLELSNRHSSLALLDEDEKGVHSMETPGGQQELAVVNEPGMYSLILRSRKPEAKRFKRWITHEVIPAIRRTGRYDTGAVIPRQLTNRELAMLVIAEADRADAAEAVAVRQAAELEAAAPKVAYVDNFLRSSDSCLVRQLAKRIGMAEKDLRAELLTRKVIFRTPVGNRFSESKQKVITEYRYEPATKYMDWFREGDHPNAPRLFNGQMRTTLYVTPAGKVGIARMLGRLDAGQPELEGATA
ncbi:phage antirepressor [Actinoplanes rectilineatus]|uniref:phage antirepressor n=1 Tax=Actinoplanes rectilineatus TaxID=113571 RepID=UPI0006983928|nr:phage antirepressor KilAC domain-containing protein [Actinoplanes rectilineatus]